jgi:oxygen-independent coproporphyrinogen-3 oxidase
LAGIYLHIPFCRQACTYCNFHFSTSLHHKSALIKALLKEIELQQAFLDGDKISTIYFGGGTPSLLDVDECELILNKLAGAFDVSPTAEITLEANPDDIDIQKLSAWKTLGINRLSIGIQSFFNEDLQWMNRAHNSQQAFRCLSDATKLFTNITIDLIYGTPLLTDEKWEQNLQTALSFQIPHLSCYALTVEERTPLHKQISQKKKEDVDADKQARQFLHLMHRLEESGYEHYEVSNFAKPGYRSKHNSGYWRGEKYLGLGPSAHSYNGAHIRRWNIANNNLYIRSAALSNSSGEEEILTPDQQYNEYVMISLRTSEGIDLQMVARRWSERRKIELVSKLGRQKYNGLLVVTDSTVQLTKEGMLMADGIASDLFI